MVVGLGGGVYSVDIGVTVVEPIHAIQRKVHCEKSVSTVKLNGTWATVFKSHLCPRVEHDAQGKDSLWQDDGFDIVCTVETKLPVDGAIRTR